MIKVYPTQPNSLAIRHPVNGALSVDGTEWMEDGFTARMLSDRAVTTDPAAGWKPDAPPAPAPAPAEPDPIKTIASELAAIESEVAALGKATK